MLYEDALNSQTESHVIAFLSTVPAQHYVLGYGSLLSRDSRERYSQIFTPGLPVNVTGFQRAWVTRSIAEQQTYVGAITDSNSQLNALLIPTAINPQLKHREKDYRFVEVGVQALSFTGAPMSETLFNALEKHTFWICETLQVLPANEQFPVHQTYIDTCLSGCFEHGGETKAHAFVSQTKGWEHPRYNDREAPKYPRAANLDSRQHSKIDAILKALS